MTSAFQEIIPEELDLFSQKPVLLCLKESSTIEYSPINTIENASTLEFVSPGYPDLLKDMSYVFLRLKCQVVKADDSKYKAKDENQPLVCTNLLYSIFRSAYIMLNNQTVSAVDLNLHYKVCIGKLSNRRAATVTGEHNILLFLSGIYRVSTELLSRERKGLI